MRATGHGSRPASANWAPSSGSSRSRCSRPRWPARHACCSPPGCPCSASPSPWSCPSRPGAAWKTWPSARLPWAPGRCGWPIRHQRPEDPHFPWNRRWNRPALRALEQGRHRFRCPPSAPAPTPGGLERQQIAAMTSGRHLVSPGGKALCLVKSQTSGAASSAGAQGEPGG